MSCLTRPITLILAIFLAGCQVFSCPSNCVTKYSGYVGDGVFSDYLDERDSQLDRYEINFGKVDLANKNLRVFNFSNLPEARRWVLGLEIAPNKDKNPTSSLYSPIVKFTLINQNNELVIAEEASLDKWIWQSQQQSQKGIGPAFLYRVGKWKELGFRPNVGYESVPIGYKSDGGWGTFFSPKAGQSFKLTVEVVRTDPVANEFLAKVVARGSNAINSP
jgi:hypothetical protein